MEGAFVCPGSKKCRRKGKSNDCLFTFRVPYENGKLEAVAYDPSGNEIGRNALETAGEETMLRAIPEESTVSAGHLCFIRLRASGNSGCAPFAD